MSDIDESEEIPTQILDDDASDDGEIILNSDEDNETLHTIQSLQPVVNTFSAYFSGHEVNILDDGSMLFQMYTNFLPLSLQVVCGFNKSPVLLEINLKLSDSSWRNPPEKCSILHPQLKNKYPGSSLVTDVVNEFFSSAYQPKTVYKSAPMLLHPPGQADEVQLGRLVSMGFDQDRARNALIIFDNSFNSALDFLRTGIFPDLGMYVDTPYSESPLVYFFLEIADAFLDLPDHCCICRAPLLSCGIKPSVCESEFCKFRMEEIGLGSSLYTEISRDTSAAELMIWLFAAATTDRFLTPKPHGMTVEVATNIFKKLPSVQDMVTHASNDSELMTYLGKDAFELVRWIIASNRSQLISLPPRLRIGEIAAPYQFLTLISTPQAEQRFAALKAEYGSKFLWHGSASSRWHSIVRNGLKNASGTSMQANGAALGDGIYMARNSSTSCGYSRHVKVPYQSSTISKEAFVIGLCEVANVPELKDHGWAHTLLNEAAVVVRFLMVADSPFTYDTIQKKLHRVPSLEEVLEEIALA